MNARLALTSAATLALLAGFVFAILAAGMFVAGKVSAPVMIALTILVNLVLWAISPTIMDWSLRWVYAFRWTEPEALAREHPGVVRFLREACKEHGVPMPRLGLIEDQSPTAFTYGSTAGNARLVVSTGLFHYLDEEEATAVYAHELGHIVHRDFIVMSFGATLVQLLYQLYVIFSRSRDGGDKKGQLAVVGLAAYVFYVLGTYLLLFLSRTREYYADRFAAEATGNPNALAMALAKIAYGIVEAEQRTGSKRLQEATRALGVFDHKAARGVGVAVESGLDTSKLGAVFLFDLFNPWATVAELNSTHPLTGKRIRALGNVARANGQEPPFDFGRIAKQGNGLDRGRMRRQFASEVGIYFAPAIGPLLGFVCGLALRQPLSLTLAGLGLGLLLKGLYSFAPGEPARADFLTLMSDPYASPLRGRPVALEGRLIGKADAGSRLSEDFMLQDRTGIIYMNYESALGVIGNMFFAWRRSAEFVDAQVEATGWFRRGVMPQYDLAELVTSEGTRLASWTRAWAIIPGALLTAVAALMFAAKV